MCLPRQLLPYGPLSMMSHCRIVFVNQFIFDTFYSVTLAKCTLVSVYMNINSVRCMMHEKILNFIKISEIFFNGLYLLISRVNSAESEGGGSLTRSILFVLQGRSVLPSALRNLFNRLTSLQEELARKFSLSFKETEKLYVEKEIRTMSLPELSELLDSLI